MAMFFVATSGPGSLGRWSAVSTGAWQEVKLDKPSEKYAFDPVGPVVPYEQPVRLKMRDTTTEVLILADSAQIFVEGRYFGEYQGQWETPNGPMGGSKLQAKQDMINQVRGNIDSGSQKASAPQKGRPPPRKRRNSVEADRSAPMVQKLFNAAEAGKGHEVTKLVDVIGVDPNCFAADGTTPLYAAAKGNHVEVVKLLLSYGADANLGQDKDNLPMIIAFKKGYKDVLNALFSASFATLDSVVTAGEPRQADKPKGEVDMSAGECMAIEMELRHVTEKLCRMDKTMGQDHGRKDSTWKTDDDLGPPQTLEDNKEAREVAMRRQMEAILTDSKDAEQRSKDATDGF